MLIYIQITIQILYLYVYSITLNLLQRVNNLIPLNSTHYSNKKNGIVKVKKFNFAKLPQTLIN